MSVWLTIPSSRPPSTANPVLQKWRDMGYKIALWCDSFEDAEAKVQDFYCVGDYGGYAEAVNWLIAHVGGVDAPDVAPCPWQIHPVDDSAEWFVIGGDDTLPDPDHTAHKIAGECRFYFSSWACTRQPVLPGDPRTFGVMQPTGDRYAGGQIDRICGSAWIGREFAKRVNQGRGPLWDEYPHMFGDQELQEVAQKVGVLWQRPDLTQLHMQYCRESAALDAGVVQAPVPEHILHDGYTPEHWLKYETLFLKRKAEGFPGSELLNG